MVVKRIENIGIEKRLLFTAIYGRQDDFFIGPDLKKFNIWHQLYLLMKKSGYDSVIYYDSNNNFHSYQSTDLEVFLNSQNKSNSKDTSSKRSCSNHIRIPPRIERNSQFTNIRNEYEHPNILKPNTGINSSDASYKLQSLANQFEHIRDFLKRNDIKTCLVYKIAESTSIRDTENMLTLFKELKQNYSLKGSKSKVIISYTTKAPEAFIELFERSNSFFCSEFFKSEFIISKGENKIINYQNTFYVSRPEEDEIRGFINRERLLKNNNFIFNINFKKVVLKLLQEVEQLDSLSHFALTDFVGSVSSKSAWNKMDEKIGMEKIVIQLRSLVNSIKFNKIRSKGIRMRPHLCFKGMLGTGKTTVAKAVAEIFKEEGLLGRGHLLSVNVGDLVAGYQGQTRIKTQKLCEEARGGVLFIDEAHGLLGKDGSIYEDEAVQTLLPYLEDEDWSSCSIVIIAGYPEEIEELFLKGDKGLTSRFPVRNHIIFEDYSALTLFDIFLSLSSDFTLNDHFKFSIQKLIEKLVLVKDKNWANARTIEELLAEIVLNYDNSEKKDNVLLFEYIPVKYHNLLNPNSKSFEQSGFNSLIGLTNAKQKINNILKSVKADKLRQERTGSKENSRRLNFIFTGHPGTGKTTVARLMGELLSSIGVLPSSEVIEVGPHNITGDVVGAAEKNMMELFQKAVGKVLFIDEIYGLVNGSSDQYGQKALTTLVALLTDVKYDGKMAIVIAGYPKKVEEFLDRNEGLSRRFNQHIHFDDYSNLELWEILLFKAKGFKFNEGSESLATKWFDSFKRDDSFSNAGLADSLLGILEENLAYDISEKPEDEVSDEELTTFKVEHFPNFNDKGKIILPSKEETSEEESGSTAVSKAIKNSPNAIVTLVLNEQKIKPPFESVVGFILTLSGTTGTGFIISSNGFVVTANHVVSGEINFEFYLDCEKNKFQLELVWFNFEQDIALLKIVSEKNDFPYISINSDVKEELIQGEEVLLLGYPFTGEKTKPFYSPSIIANYEQNAKMGEENTFDAIYSYNQSTHGYSGGPLIRKSDDKVLGVLLGGIKEKGNINVASDIRQLFFQKNLIISNENTKENTNNIDKIDTNLRIEKCDNLTTNDLSFDSIYFDLDCFSNVNNDNQIISLDRRILPSVKSILKFCQEKQQNFYVFKNQLDEFSKKIEKTNLEKTEKKNFDKAIDFIRNSFDIIKIEYDKES